MKPIRVAINGFGQIGRTFFRQAFNKPHIDIVAINDLCSPDDILYGLKYDSSYGGCEIGRSVTIDDRDNSLWVSDWQRRKTLLLAERDPGRLPWKDLGIDVVVDASGVFDTVEKLTPHLTAGAKRVVVTAPAKDDMPMFTPNVNEEAARLGCITSNASCTTNAIIPIAKVLLDAMGIEDAKIHTVHAYTATQKLVDGVGAKKDPRRGRAAAENVSPAETGAAKAVGRIIPELAGKFYGTSTRIPVPTGSWLDCSIRVRRSTSREEINEILTLASMKPQWQGILGVTNEPLVLKDIVGSSYGSLVQLDMTHVRGTEGRDVSVYAWYDNVWGYCAMLLRHVRTVANLL